MNLKQKKIYKEHGKELKAWAKQVKYLDNNECAICDKKEYLNAHHIIPVEVEETRLDVLNGITLCPSHHKFSWLLSAHTNPLAFFVWLEENRPHQYEYLKNKIKNNNN